MNQSHPPCMKKRNRIALLPPLLLAFISLYFLVSALHAHPNPFFGYVVRTGSWSFGIRPACGDTAILIFGPYTHYFFSGGHYIRTFITAGVPSILSLLALLGFIHFFYLYRRGKTNETGNA